MKKYVKPVWNNKTEISDKMVKWFEGRGITQPTLKRMKISEGLEWMPQTQKEVNTIQFPYIRDGEIVNVKFRDAKKNFKLVKDAEKIWYNYDNMNSVVVIVEGEMDVLSFVEAGVGSCISVPNGANNFNFGTLNPDKVIIAVDNDEPGSKLKAELIRRFGAEICSVIDWGEFKDANEFLVKRGKMALSAMINKAKDVPVSGVMTADMFYPELVDLYQNGLRPGKKTRHNKLNELITFETARLMTVTGIPGCGKSEFVDELLVQLSTLHGWRAGFFSPENFPIQLHISKLIAKLAGTWMDRLSIEELDKFSEMVRDSFYWVMPDDEYHLDVILEKARYLIRKYGIKIFVIDPWNMLEYTAPNNLTETQYISKCLTQISNFARQNNILMIIVAHPKKMEKNSDGFWDVPNLYSINGSAHFFNKTDYGVTVFRTESDDVEIHVQKVKFRHLGQKGYVTMKNSKFSGRYYEIGSVDYELNQPFKQKEIDF